MMPEILNKEEEDEEEKLHRTLQDRVQTTGLIRIAKLHQSHSRGHRSSLQASIKRTRASTQSDNNTEGSRPNVPIISAEPQARNVRFTGATLVFAPQTGWSTNIQTVSQVIKEKTQKDSPAKPTAAPHQSICKSTTQTQTDPVRKKTLGATSTPAETRPAAKKPQKPPRSSLSKVSEVKSDLELVATTPEQTSTESSGRACSPNLGGFEKADSQRVSRSVTVYWNISKNQSDTVSVEPPTSNLEQAQRPVPRPRTKLNKNTIKQELHTLGLEQNSDTFQSYLQTVPTNKYLEELPEVFGKHNKFEEGRCDIDKSYAKLWDEDADGIMNGDHNHRNLRGRIQAFESQTGAEGEDGSQSATPNLPPRRASYKPPVASKPSAAPKPQSANNGGQNMTASQKHELVTRPKPPIKPLGHSIRQELEALHSKGGTQQRSLGLNRSFSIHEEEPGPIPPIPPVKPWKEPLKPNLNINNHSSHAENGTGVGPLKKVPLKPQYSLDSGGGSASRQGVGRRPTTIRVPSKTSLDNFHDVVPPLPVKKPIGQMNSSSASFNQSLKSSKSFENTFNTGPQPPLPPRKPSMNKSLPPRPPPAKADPGRPPPPSLKSAGRSKSEPLRPSPKLKPHNPTKKGLVLPPRPSPGHRLYNDYVLQLPHGIASADFDGSNTGELTLQKNEVLLILEKINHKEFECQIGETRGRVHKQRIKIITPLDSDSSYPQEVGAQASGGGGDGLNVKVLYDFDPEGPRELSLKAGDVVTEVEQVDNQWYRGTCNGSTGYFPISYVEVTSHSPKPSVKKKPKTQPASVSGPRCVARFDFEGEHADELSFSEGDLIKLMEHVGEDWARGQTGFSVGIFPLNFVDIVEDLPPPRNQQSAARIALPGLAAPPIAQPAAAKPAQTAGSSVEWAVALYDYTAETHDELSFHEDDCILITEHLSDEWSSGRLNGRDGMFPRAYVAISAGENRADLQNGAAGNMRGKALYSFTSDNEEELSFQVGDILTNLESVDGEWFLGELRGNRALVPKNYVQVLD